ncbi:unnamed protein product [Fusarium venenatum]|uniref:Uncharacterized protein n=1 Tax=Fusarium venenatum TaxID=56646 RepID=A0A2L2STY5_9HYPO|nr:uncharacterized protein FVRRES_05260 [Fusarium venenatum]CEI60824.1 unnamed protein product [Fusarium venenatum]
MFYKHDTRSQDKLLMRRHFVVSCPKENGVSYGEEFLYLACKRLPCDLSCAIECALKRGRWLSAGGAAVMFFGRQGQPTVTPEYHKRRYAL